MPQETTTSRALPTLDEWARALLRALAKTAPGMGFDACEMKLDERAPMGDTGASLSLVSEHQRVQISLLGERAGLERLARTFMMLPDDEALVWLDAADAVSEIVNVVAGALKSEMIDEVPSLRLGLPLFAETLHHRPGTRRKLALVVKGARVTMSVRVGSVAG